MHKKIIIKTIKKQERKIVKKWNNKDYLLNMDNHIQIVNQLYLDQSFTGSVCARRDIIRKLNSYKQQDKKHGILHDDFFIGFETMIKKLVSSKLQCYYCTCNCLFLYEDSYDDTQWTLDRIDNNKGHTDSNTVICCLKCNLSRGNIHQDRFIESKKISIVRKIE
jgi:hypothetical protein